MQPDGWYNRRPWDSLPEARLTATLGALANAPADQIRALKPPLPNTQLFPPMFGYDRRALGVEDCFGMQPRYRTAMNDYTRPQPGHSGSSVPSIPQG